MCAPAPARCAGVAPVRRHRCAHGRCGSSYLAGAALTDLSPTLAVASHVASFSMCVATMGSGKTSTVLAAAIRVLDSGWDDCKDHFGEWSQKPVNLDPSEVAGRARTGTGPTSVIPRHSERVARVAFFVATKATFSQWAAVARGMAEAHRPGFFEVSACEKCASRPP